MNRETEQASLKRLSIFSSIVALIFLLIKYLEVPYFYHRSLWIVAVMFSLNYVNIRVIYRLPEEDFIAGFFSSMVMRVFGCLAAVTYFVYVDRENAKSFMLSFGILYLSYLWFEIYSLLTTFRRISKNPN
ncbi:MULTISPECIES: hypothetical protein [Persicobacter]|uniref:Uncharacterized protein n=1 Tax=Persicobacter diffluens TaxID=981 RepID=A0AAN4W085_9BACT|nr:hypothetical protein [Persicobacter sp. CCB-QB2]GJM62208.1 hypothetical protein PEDI_27600 [Persicobacter diffluens]